MERMVRNLLEAQVLLDALPIFQDALQHVDTPAYEHNRDRDGAIGTVYVFEGEEKVLATLRSLLHSVGIEMRVVTRVDEIFGNAEMPSAPSCVLLDVWRRGISGLSVQAKIVERQILTSFILIATDADALISVRAMKAGAFDFLVKPFPDQELLEAINGALQADRNRLCSERGLNSLRYIYKRLTPRERQVLASLMSGKINKQ